MSVDREKLQAEAEQARTRNEARIAAQRTAHEEKIQAIVDRWMAHILAQVLITGRAGQPVYHYSLDAETAKLHDEAQTKVEANCKALAMNVTYSCSYNEQGYGELMSKIMFVAS
jgi:hypothetical protein